MACRYQVGRFVKGPHKPICRDCAFTDPMENSIRINHSCRGKYTQKTWARFGTVGPQAPAWFSAGCVRALLVAGSGSHLVLAYGRVNDPMAKLQFLRVGWGGVGMMTFFELEHMLDAKQLCLSCHCTHAGCYATVFVLSLHTCWMLRNCVCLVIAHMLDATQLCLSCHCTHAGCYATVFVLRAAELA